MTTDEEVVVPRQVRMAVLAAAEAEYLWLIAPLEKHAARRRLSDVYNRELRNLNSAVNQWVSDIVSSRMELNNEHSQRVPNGEI